MPKSIEQEVTDLKGQVAALEKSAADSKAAHDAIQFEAKTAKDALTVALADVTAKQDTISTQATEIASLKSEAKASTDALAEFGLKIDAGAKVNHDTIKAHVEKLASSRAAEIVASQGGNSALNTGAAAPVGNREVTVTGRAAVAAKLCGKLSGAK
jgi:chromosome segregation ATPase